MNDSSVRVVGRVASSEIKKKFAKTNEKQMVLVQGFFADEVAEIASRLSDDPDFGHEVLVIANDTVSGLSDELRLPSDASVTSYRTSDPRSYCFLQLDEFSDLSSLGHVYAIEDGTLLGQHGSDATAAKNCVLHVWGELQAHGGSLFAARRCPD